MQKQEYQEPVMEIVSVDLNDLIFTSGDSGDEHVFP